MKTSIDYQNVKNESIRLSLIINEFDNYLSEIESLLVTLPIELTGNAEIRLFNKLVYIKKEYEKMNMFFKSMSTKLRSIAEEYERFEDDFSSKLNLV